MKTILTFLLALGIVPIFAQVVVPEQPIDFTNPESVYGWWQFVYAVLSPVAVWVFNKFFPSSNKQELVLKSTSILIVILIAVLFVKGFTFNTIFQGAVALIMAVFSYDKILQPLGLNSEKTRNYHK